MRSSKFKLYELVPQELYDTIHPDVLWNILDDKLLLSIDAIKKKFPLGSMSVNTYKWGGTRNQSGLRTKHSKYYSKSSQHSIGKAVDCIFTAYPTDSVRKYILGHPTLFPHIGGIELGVSWLHIDVRKRKGKKIKTFKG